MLFKKNYNKRTQDLKKNIAYDAGQFYWAKDNTWEKCKKIFSLSSSVILIPNWRSIDINTKYDWKFALKLNKLNKII